MKVLKERNWLKVDIGMLKRGPKEYYRGVFKEIIEEIKENNRDLHICSVCEA